MVQFREKRATGTVCYLVQINYFCIFVRFSEGSYAEESKLYSSRKLSVTIRQ